MVGIIVGRSFNMCLCNGTGGIHIEHSWGIEYHHCPDSNCEFDLSQSEKQYEVWKQKMFEQMEVEKVVQRQQ